MDGKAAFLAGLLLLGVMESEQRCAAAAVGGITGLQVFGDSLGDEYSQRSYSYARNWIEQLATNRGVNFGAFGEWGAPRDRGYEYNWAIYGATSFDLVLGSFLYGDTVRAQMRSGQVSHLVLAIGANDFFPSSGSPYAEIYNETWTTEERDEFMGWVAGNVDYLLSIAQNEGLKVVLGNIPDYGITPYARSNFPNAARRELVAAALVDMNAQLEAIAQARQIPYVDIYGLAKEAFGTHLSPNATMSVGDISINLLNAGSAANNAFVADRIHPHTVVQGILGNAFVEALNQGYGTTLAPFTEAEILAHAGLAYGGRDTLSVDVRDYVTNYVVPEPSSWALTVMGACGVMLARARRRKSAAASCVA